MGKIDWDKIRVTIVPADKEKPNVGNPYIKLSPAERDEVRIAICGRIWARHVREKLCLGGSSNNGEDIAPPKSVPSSDPQSPAVD